MKEMRRKRENIYSFATEWTFLLERFTVSKMSNKNLKLIIIYKLLKRFLKRRN